MAGTSVRSELLPASVPRLRFPGLGLTVEGVSVAGVETWLRVPEWSLAIDVGRAPEVVARCKHLALTHAHMDHSGGLAQYLALRKMYSLGPCTVYAPAPACRDLGELVAAWERLHGSPFHWHLQPMEPGDEVDLGKGRFLRAFAVAHVVPSLGYAVLERPRRLLPRYAGLTEAELRALAAVGTELSAPTERVLLAASGDTLARGLDRAEDLHQAEVALVEATFLDGRRTLDEAHWGGHVHLDELVQRAELFRGRYLVPYHVSQIYRAAEALEILHRRLPPDLEARTVALLPGERELAGREG